MVGGDGIASIDFATDDWRLETWIQWEDSTSAPPQLGDLIGFNIVVHDVDFAGEPADRWSWAPCEGGAVLASGMLRLIDEGAPAPACAGRCASGACPGPGYVCERGLATACDP